MLELAPDPATASSSTASSSSSTASSGPELPEHGIRTGDIVLVAEQPGGGAKKREVREMEGKGVKGVVTRVGKGIVGVAVDGEGKRVGGGGKGVGTGEEDGVERLMGEKRVWVVKVADDVTFRR